MSWEGHGFQSRGMRLHTTLTLQAAEKLRNYSGFTVAVSGFWVAQRF